MRRRKMNDLIIDCKFKNGYRIFTRTRGRLFDFGLKSERLDDNILSDFVDAYIKRIHPQYNEK